MFEDTPKNQTIELRLSADQKSLIERAAGCVGKPPAEFILDTILEEAANAIFDQREILLDEQAFTAFQAMLDSPPEPSEELRKLLAKRPAWENQ